MRIIDSDDACRNDEARITWNQAGPAGPPGPAGAQGPQGARGPAGPSTPPASRLVREADGLVFDEIGATMWAQGEFQVPFSLVTLAPLPTGGRVDLECRGDRWVGDTSILATADTPV